MDKDFTGLCFTNLVDYDMLYGHRNDVDGYAKALTHFDERLPELLAKLREDDILMITADHGCDPSTPSTDHSKSIHHFLCMERILLRVRTMAQEAALQTLPQPYYLTST